jgi:iron complex transport system ATP-binding protein
VDDNLGAVGSGAPAWRETGIAGLRWRAAGGIIHLKSDRSLATLASASRGGGYRSVRNIVNVHVDRRYNSDQPERDLDALAGRLDIAGDYVGLLTAVHVEKGALVARESDGLRVVCLGTAGVGNATCAGRETPWREPADVRPGTINLIVVADADLAPEAMVNLVISATEAKTLALAELGIRTAAGEMATGTSTDAVVIAGTGAGPRLRYGGPATLVGYLVAQCVHEAVRASLTAPEPEAPAASPLRGR